MQVIGENHDRLDEEGGCEAGLAECRAQIGKAPNQQVITPSRRQIDRENIPSTARWRHGEVRMNTM
jgi:hypothetical protein